MNEKNQTTTEKVSASKATTRNEKGARVQNSEAKHDSKAPVKDPDGNPIKTGKTICLDLKVGKGGYLILVVLAIIAMIIVGSNAWAVFVITTIIAMALLGFKQYRPRGWRDGWRIESRFDDSVYAVVTAVLAVIFAVLLYCCRGEALIAWHDQTGYTDLSVAAALLAVVIAAMALALTLYLTGRAASMVKYGLLSARQPKVRLSKQTRRDVRRCDRAWERTEKERSRDYRGRP